MTIDDILKTAPILPVIVIDDLKDALPLASALAEGGIDTLEITLRTPSALFAIEEISRELPNCVIGAGTVIKPSQFSDIKNAGATFAISPGIAPHLLTAAKSANFPYLPAIATPSEILIAIQHDISILKFYPAALHGGANTLKAYHSLFSSLLFCPTGGVTIDNMADYLTLPNVISIGGTWLAPARLIKEKNWNQIKWLAKAAVAKLREIPS